jgi:hypothetical protein
MWGPTLGANPYGQKQTTAQTEDAIETNQTTL